MVFFPAVFIALISVCVAKLNLETTSGENLTIPLETAELDRADQVMITRTRGSQKKLIARYCGCAHCGDCNAVETTRVLLKVKEGALLLLDVSSRDSGLYEVNVIRRNNTSETHEVTLVVNKRVFSSSREPAQTSITKPPQTFISKPPQSISKPPNSSERQRIFVVIAPVVFIMVVICLFCKYKRELMLK